MTLNIRMATMDDLNRLMEIFDHARHFMKETGNASQWINGYPQRELIANEIASAHCFVCEKNKNIVGTFCFIQGPDPTYQYIEKGKWLNENPYYVIHRIASDGSCKGLFQECLAWCFAHCNNLRIDTHDDNKIMQHLLKKNKFTRCGIIYTNNGTARIAFQKQM